MWLCKLFGHKYVGRIVTQINFIESYSREIEPYCKRCGVKINN